MTNRGGNEACGVSSLVSSDDGIAQRTRSLLLHSAASVSSPNKFESIVQMAPLEMTIVLEVLESKFSSFINSI